MSVLEFKQISSNERDVFRAKFQAYLEEIDLLVGDSIEPDFHKRYPEYNAYFAEQPGKEPFHIYYISGTEDTTRRVEPIGFFFLNLITPKDFPPPIKSIYDDESVKVASLTEFYIYSAFRQKGIAWNFYDAIINLCTDSLNQWHCCFECDARNTPAIAFYDKVVERIQKTHKFVAKKEKYQKAERGGQEYYFYQIKFTDYQNA